jgi:hypothetical protein
MTETEFFFWSSVEAAPTINGDEDEEHFRTEYAQFEQMLKFISRRKHPEKGSERDIDGRFAPLEHRLIYPHFLQMLPKHLDKACFLPRFSTSAGFLFTGY